jgi:LysM repeat protein
MPSASTAEALAQPREPRSDGAGVIQEVNALRAANGLQPYSVNSILVGTAQGQADYMASIGTWSHTGPGGSSVTQRLLAAGYPLAGDLSLGGFRSENVVMGTGMTPAEAVAAWTGDSIHLHTMLSADLQEIGAGVAERDGTFYYVIDCARPTSGGVPQAYTPGAEAAYSAALNQIIVPVALSTANSAGEIIHEVKPGQSLWQIAIEYGVKIDDIRRMNKLSSAYVINPGDTLVIKQVGTATPAPPTETTTPPATQAEASESIDTPLPASETPTPTTTSHAPGVPAAGTAVGAIIVTALAAAALVAWVGRARPV